jgi:hypothetical protein
LKAADHDAILQHVVIVVAPPAGPSLQACVPALLVVSRRHQLTVLAVVQSSLKKARRCSVIHSLCCTAHRHCHCGDGGWVFGGTAGAVSGARPTARRVPSSFDFAIPTLARAFAETMQKAKIVCLAVLTRLARLGLQGAGLEAFRIFPADEGDAKSLFAPRRRIAAHLFVVHMIVAEIGAIAGRSDELGDVALGNSLTVAAVCGLQDLYGICGLFPLR